MKVKKESEKVGLKISIQKIKIMASGPIASWQIDGETMETVRNFILGAPKSLQMMTAAMKLNDTYSFEEKLWPTWVQFSGSVVSDLCDPMNCSTPGLPVRHQHLEFTHVHRVGDAIQSSHPLSSPSPPAPNPSQHQSLFQWVNSSHEVAKVLEFRL